MKTLIMTRGAAGSGKSSLASELWLKTPDCVVLNTDEVYCVNYGPPVPRPELWNPEKLYLWSAKALREAHIVNRMKCEVAMERGIGNIIIDNTNTTWQEIEAYVLLAKQYGYSVEFMEPVTEWRYNAEECAKRNRHNVPLEVVKKQLDRLFKEPTDYIIKKYKDLM